MLKIISGRFPSKRRVTYQPKRKNPSGRTMSDILRDQKEKDKEKEQDLERRFQAGLQQTASWRHVWGQEH